MKKYFWLIVYAIFTFILVLHHEIWADEAQVWQLCKHLSFIELFKHLVNEGHPSFFYLLNMPFAKLGVPIFAMQIICWLASCGAVYLILDKSPFNNLTKFALITSAGFLYFFPVIARSYSILPLMVFALAMLYPKQKEHPYWYAIIIFLMANTHVIMLGFAGMLTLMFMWENLWKNRKEFSFNVHKNYVFSSVIAVIGLLAVVVQLHGTTSSNIFIKFDFQNLIYSSISVITKFFVVGFDSSFSEELNMLSLTNNQFLLMLLSMVLFVWLFVLLYKTSKKIFLVSFFAVLFQLLIYILAYSKCMQVTRVYSAYLILIFAFWVILNVQNITVRMKKIINILLISFFMLTIFNGLRYSLLEIFNPYSGAKQTAEYIKNNIPQKSFLMTDNAPYCISVIQYLDEEQDIFSMRDMKAIKYIVWNENMYKFLPADAYDVFIQYMKNKDERFKSQNIYVILSSFHKYFLNIGDLQNFQLIYKSKPSMLKYENYYIYKYMGNN